MHFNKPQHDHGHIRRLFIKGCTPAQIMQRLRCGRTIIAKVSRAMKAEGGQQCS